MIPHPFWQHVGNIYCINLYERDDRYEHAQKEFDRVGLLDRVCFHRVHRHSTSGVLGLFNSFLEVLKIEYEKYTDCVIPKPIVIFEDDLVFLQDRMHYLDELAQLIKGSTYEDWDTIRLGHVKPCFVERVSDNVFRGNALHTHAVVYSPRFVERIVKARIDPTKLIGKRVHIDHFLMNVTGRNYIPWEQIVSQGKHGSDINWKVVEGDEDVEQLQRSFLENSENYIVSQWEHSVALWKEVEPMRSVDERITHYRVKCVGHDICRYVLENESLL